MSHLAIAAIRRRSFGGSKGALYRETLQATGFYVGRILIATAGFAPMPPSALPGYPGGIIPTAIGMRFSGMAESIWSDGVHNPKTKSWVGTTPPPAGRAPSPGKRTRREDHALSHRPQMSSGRLFLDRVGRHQSPSPLHRHGQDNLIARTQGTNYHRMVSSVLTGCLTIRDKRTDRRTTAGTRDFDR